MERPLNSAAGAVEPRAKAAQAHPRQPSARNVEIFGLVRTMRVKQVEVARRFGLTKSRVSQICRQVQIWQEWARQRSQTTTAGQAELRLVRRQLARVRTEHLYVLVVRELLSTKRELVTERRIDRGGVVTVDRRARANPLGTQWLKMALRLSADLAGLEADIEPDERFSASPIGQELARRVAEISDEYLRTALNSGLARGATQDREIPKLPHPISETPAAKHGAASDSRSAATCAAKETCGDASGLPGRIANQPGGEKKCG